MDAHTAINGYEWAVSMPRDANLDLIRIEMLNHGVDYAWLDVLCLRQAGGRREDLRAEEWKVDVPTIGWVYASQWLVVCYLSGLGRPFSLKENDLESDTCWFRRAWTMQEASEHMIIGGDTGDDRFIEKEMRTMVENRLSLLEEGVGASKMLVFLALSEMQKRVSMNPLDRVAGLSYPCGPMEYLHTMRRSLKRTHGTHWSRRCQSQIGGTCSSCILNPGTETSFGDHHGSKPWMGCYRVAVIGAGIGLFSVRRRKMLPGVMVPVSNQVMCGDCSTDRWRGTSERES